MYEHIPNEIWESWTLRARGLARGSVGRRLLPYVSGEAGTIKVLDDVTIEGIVANIVWCFSKAYRLGIDEQTLLEGVYVSSNNTLEFKKWFKEMRLVESGFLDAPIEYLQDPNVDVNKSGYRIQARGRKDMHFLYGDYVTATEQSRLGNGNQDALHDNPLAVLQGRALSDFISKHARGLFMGNGKVSAPAKTHVRAAAEDTRVATGVSEMLDEELIIRQMAMEGPIIAAARAPRAGKTAAGGPSEVPKSSPPAPAPVVAPPPPSPVPATDKIVAAPPVSGEIKVKNKPGPKPGWKQAAREKAGAAGGNGVEAGAASGGSVEPAPAQEPPPAPTPSDAILDLGRRAGTMKDDMDVDDLIPAARDLQVTL